MKLTNLQITLCDAIYIKFQKEEAKVMYGFRSQHIWCNSSPWHGTQGAFGAVAVLCFFEWVLVMQKFHFVEMHQFVPQ